MTLTKKSEDRRGLSAWFEKLDMRYIYLAFIVLLVIPIVRPLGLPVLISPSTSNLYDFVENKIGKGDRVLLWGDMTFAWWPTDFKPGVIAMSQHFFNKGAKLYFISIGPEDPMIVDMMLKTIDKGAARYGADYVVLGYYSGGEVALSSFAKDVRGLVKTDYYGTGIDQLPMMKEVNDAKDFKCVIALSSRPVEWFLRQYKSAYGIPVGWATTSGLVGTIIPYFASGQVTGYIAGLRGGAEYETLMKKRGIGLASTDAVSIGNLYFAAIMILACVVHFAQRKERKKE